MGSVAHTRLPRSSSRFSTSISLSVLPTGDSPLIVRVNGDSVLLPRDQGLGKPMDLALEAGYTTLLTHGGLGVHVEI